LTFALVPDPRLDLTPTDALAALDVLRKMIAGTAMAVTDQVSAARRL
jgi:hypothetical protein